LPERLIGGEGKRALRLTLGGIPKLSTIQLRISGLVDVSASCREAWIKDNGVGEGTREHDRDYDRNRSFVEAIDWGPFQSIGKAKIHAKLNARANPPQ
jgi:hypothetical protein